MTLRLTSYLKTNQGLLHLSQRARHLVILQNHYLQIVSPPLAQASRVTQLRGTTLILAADNGAVAAKLRQTTPNLISLLRTRGCEVTGIQIRVQVRSLATPSSLPARTIGADGKKELENLALNLRESPLKQALQRLARR